MNSLTEHVKSRVLVCWVYTEKRERPLLETSCRIVSHWGEEKRKTNKKMEGQCKERPGVEGAEGGRLRVEGAEGG